MFLGMHTKTEFVVSECGEKVAGGAEFASLPAFVTLVTFWIEGGVPIYVLLSVGIVVAGWPAFCVGSSTLAT